jgi:hypothetical protein
MNVRVSGCPKEMPTVPSVIKVRATLTISVLMQIGGQIETSTTEVSIKPLPAIDVSIPHIA